MKQVTGHSLALTVPVWIVLFGLVAGPARAQESCPAGTQLIAKFEWQGKEYKFEKPDGGDKIVQISGNATTGSWTATTGIAAVILKGATDTDQIVYDPSATAGSFSNANLSTRSGKRPDISNIQFCAGTPDDGGDNPGGDDPGGDNPGGDDPGGDNPNTTCPAGLELTAKFEVSGGGYVFEKPEGNAGIIQVAGNDQSASWNSSTGIGAVVLKGARDTNLFYYPGLTSGVFTNSQLFTSSGRNAGISNVQFCNCPASKTSGPVISIVVNGDVFEVTVTDDVGIGAVTFDHTNTEVTSSNFVAGAKSASFTVRRVNGSLPAVVTVHATDLCGNKVSESVDPCLVDQGPPQVSYDIAIEAGIPKLYINVTDDVGIASLSVSDQQFLIVSPFDYTGDNTLVFLPGESGTFVPGMKSIQLVYQIPDPTKGQFVYVQTEDLCGQSKCQTPFNRHTQQGVRPPRVSWGNTVGNLQSGVIESRPDGADLDVIDFFLLTNASAAYNVASDKRSATFQLTRTGAPYIWGVLVTDAACAATVIDPTTVEGAAQKYATQDALLELATVRSDVPDAFELSSSYPNPFNPATTIRFAVPEESAVRLMVFDMLGRPVQVLADQIYAPGRYEVRFDGTGLVSGTYFYRLETPGQTFIKSMILVK